ncbi:MAG: lipopolysaccharide kinase InaA family protein [Gemmataceae bacterium]
MVRFYQRTDWSTFVGAEWYKHIMSKEVTDNHHAKQGRSTGRLILKSAGKTLSVYLKRHYHLSLWSRLRALLHPHGNYSPAMQEWQHLRWAKEQGLPVPSPVAVAEYIGPYGRLCSMLAVEELIGMAPLHEVIPALAAKLAPDTFCRWKRSLVQKIARITRDLHHRRYYHKDLYLCHFYIPYDAKSGSLPDPESLHLIDFHRLQRHSVFWWWWQAKDLAQLWYSSEIKGIHDLDRVCFWRCYLERDGWSLTHRCVRLLALCKWWLYRRHNQKRVQRNDGESKLDQ